MSVMKDLLDMNGLMYISAVPAELLVYIQVLSPWLQTVDKEHTNAKVRQ